MPLGAIHPTEHRAENNVQHERHDGRRYAETHTKEACATHRHHGDHHHKPSAHTEDYPFEPMAATGKGRIYPSEQDAPEHGANHEMSYPTRDWGRRPKMCNLGLPGSARSTRPGFLQKYSFRLFGSVDELVIWELLINCSKIEHGRARKLGFCKIGHEACFAANLDLIDRDRNKSLPDAEETAQRKDECC